MYAGFTGLSTKLYASDDAGSVFYIYSSGFCLNNAIYRLMISLSQYAYFSSSCRFYQLCRSISSI